MSKLIDTVMINLKLISKIEENKKVSTKNNIIETQLLGVLPECLSRYIQGDDRNKALMWLDRKLTGYEDLVKV